MSQFASAASVSREEMILSHLPQVRLIAQRIWERSARRVELEDLISEGVTGLIQAVDRYDPSRNCQLKTLADHRIRGAILDYLRHLDPLPRTVRHFVRERRALAERFESARGHAPDEHELANELGISIKRYRQLDCIARADKIRSLETLPESAIRWR